MNTRNLVKGCLTTAIIVVAFSQISAIIPISFKRAVQLAPIVVRVDLDEHRQFVVREVLKGELELGPIAILESWDLYFQPAVGGTYLVALTKQLEPYTGGTACGTFNIMGVSGEHLYYFSFYIPDENSTVTLGFYERNDNGSRATLRDVERWLVPENPESQSGAAV